MSQGIFNKNSKPILLFFSFYSPPQPSFHLFDPHVANFVSGPVMVDHVPDHLVVPIGLLQQLIQVKSDSLKPSLSIIFNLILNRIQSDMCLFVTFSFYLEHFQLYEDLFVTQLLVFLFQICDYILDPLQIFHQSLYLSLLFLYDDVLYGFFVLSL